jgi:excisionase family DNA binding protein
MVTKTVREFLKPVEVAEAIGISRTKVYWAIQRGEIPSTRIAGMLRVPRVWVEQQVRAALDGASEGERNDG